MTRDRRRYVLALFAAFVAYVVGGKLGLQLAHVHASATAVWPPTGIAIAACLVFGTRMWPAIYAAAFVVNLTTSGDVVSSLGIALGNTLEGVVGAALARRYANGRYAFLHTGTVLRFAALATFVATPISATIGVSTLALTGLARWSDFGPIWLTWWLGDASGAIVFAPLLVLWATPVPALKPAGTSSELIALLATVAAVAIVTFSPLSPLAVARAPIGFFVFPILVWPVVRFGPRVAAAIAAAIAVIAVWGATQGAGPWVRDDPEASLLLLEAFMAVASLTSLTVGAAVVERQVAMDALRETEERLRIAEEQKVAARDEFLSVAAHELKTPLTSLQLAAQYLLREIDSGRALPPGVLRSAAAALSSQTQRMAELIGQLLDTVRIQADRMDLQIGEEDVAELARRVAREMQATAPRHEIEVRAPEQVPAAVDPIRVEQVLRNLIDNAVKFSPPSKVAVDVSSVDGTVEVSVRDHGPGIPEGVRDHVFERFFQARNDGHRGGAGLGLGLYVSRHIVELHGGSISAGFPTDGGTRIIVRLPARVAASGELGEAVR